MGKYMRRAELKELVADAGREILREQGLQLGLGAVTFAKVFDRIEKTKGRRIVAGSVNSRIWASQAEFQQEVLSDVLKAPSPIDGAARELVLAALAEADTSTPQARREALAGICRIATELYVARAATDAQSSITAATLSAITSSENPSGTPSELDPATFRAGPLDQVHGDRVREAVAVRLSEQVAVFRELFGQVGYRLGYQMRDPYTIETLVAAISAVTEGFAIRARCSAAFTAPMPTPPPESGGPGQGEWSLAAVCVATLVESMVVMDPHWSPERAAGAPAEPTARP